MWPNWSRRDFSHHEIMCKLLELEYIHGLSERSRIIESLIQDLEGKFNKVIKSDYYLCTIIDSRHEATNAANQIHTTNNTFAPNVRFTHIPSVF